jgi:Protein of unknown function (DUF669)
MSFEFDPMTDEELEALIPDGEYDFEVIKSIRKSSSKGNPMAVLDLKVWDKTGNAYYIFDHLIFMKVNMCIKKISRFCKATRIYDEYKAGSIREDLGGLCGKAVIGTQEEMPNPKGGVYARKNIVVDYLPDSSDMKKSIARAVVDAPIDPAFNDDLPF